jgi:hypothetical protein
VKCDEIYDVSVKLNNDCYDDNNDGGGGGGGGDDDDDDDDAVVYLLYLSVLPLTHVSR